VHIAQPFFQPHNRIAAGGEAEMPRLDDPGVDGTDWDLMQAFSFDREKGIRSGTDAAASLSERRARVPPAMIEPWARIGRSDRIEAEQILDRTLKPNGRRVQGAD
jgi:hypothetical protein